MRRFRFYLSVNVSHRCHAFIQHIQTQCLKIIVPMAKTNKFSLLTAFTPNIFQYSCAWKIENAENGGKAK